MSIIINEVLGLVFFALSFVLLLLMFYGWGFAYDKETRKSQAPAWLRWAHRILGYAYVLIYIYLMWQMVPRLWGYQIELPARTVAHLLLGMAIGAILLVKILIIRFFPHLEAKLVPYLGVSLFICTALLMGLALPVALRESFLHDNAISQGNVNEERLLRVREQLPKTGLNDADKIDALASAEGLVAGRQILVTKCVQCHDLRTILARPRTPQSWQQTVSRMANRSTVLSPISEDEQWAVTAYLIAISPTLQRSLMSKRSLDQDMAASADAISMAGERMSQSSTDSFDVAAAKAVFEQRCSQCHAHQLVAASPPMSMDAALALVSRMVRNGLRGTDEELETIVRYLVATYANESQAAALTPPPAERPADAQTSPKETPTVNDGPYDETITVTPAAEELRFAVAEFAAKVGQRVKIEFNNTSGSTHNFAVLASDADIDEAITAGLSAIDTGFLPDHPSVLGGITALPGGQRAAFGVTFTAPGEYPFVCLMPGHGFTMRGVIRVTE